MITRELSANGLQKSFYGKAIVITKGKTEYLKSYDTIVLVCKNDEFFRTNWTADTGNYSRYIKDLENWSHTTGQHIKAYCGLNKKEYLGLPIYKGAINV